MRTTLTVEDHIATQIRRLQKLHGKSLKAVINEALLVGVDVLLHPQQEKKAKRYRIRPVHAGPRIDNLDNVWDVIATLDGENTW